MRVFQLIIFVSIVSCHSKQETSSFSAVKLSIDEVKFPIPDNMPNDWGFGASSWEGNERILHLYDLNRKEISQYSLDQEKLLKKVSPFSDTLDPRNVSVHLYRLDGGYYLSSSNLGFMRIDDEGSLIKLWNNFIPRSNRINNWDYDFKYSLRTSKTMRLSMLDEWTIPLQVEITNASNSSVFSEDFYNHDLFAILDMKEGLIKRFPIRFPKDFLVNGRSYPRSSVPAFTALGKGKIAYNFGMNDTIHVLDIRTGEVVDHAVPNNEVPVDIMPMDQDTFMDSNQSSAVLANSFYYSQLNYDPYRNGLVRMGLKTVNGETTRVLEIINEDMKIIGQFEVPQQYSPVPYFFPNEMWFPYWRGFAEDQMKLMRVRIED
jgi:hypothetical protein